MRRNIFALTVALVFAAALLVTVWYRAAVDSDKNSASAAIAVEQGRQMYRNWGCVTCHGDDGHGSPKGPGLRGISSNWNKALLIEYLENPGEFRKRDPRLGELSRKYFPISMPLPEGLTERERALIADYLLSLK